MAGCLYVVGTPIGNLQDISKRALKTLKEVDFIIAEDCRITLKLLNSYGIKKPLISNHKFTSSQKANYIVNKIKNGESAAIVSDAGMPCICDPGELIVRLCYENQVEIKVVPGPCALVAAICLSGINCSRFTFFGFLSVNNKNRKKDLEFLKELGHTVILYEAPHKLVRTLKDLLEYFDDRVIVLVKEITKLHEDVETTTILKALNKYENMNKIKGEFVLLIKGKELKETEKFSLKDAVEFAKQLIEKGESVSFAAKKAASYSNLKKSEIYKILIS